MKLRFAVIPVLLAFLAAGQGSSFPGAMTGSEPSRALDQSASGGAVIPAGAVSSPGGLAHHAVGDFNADGLDELLVDLGTEGIWWYDRGGWNRITTANPEGMVLAEFDGDAGAEVFVDGGASGFNGSSIF